MEDEEWLEERKKMQDHLEELKKELDAYCLQLIYLGFNSKTTREEVKTGILVSRRRQTIRKGNKPFGHWYVVGFQELKQSNISLQEYEFCQCVWVERRMRTFKDFLEWYNNLVVEPFVTAVERFFDSSFRDFLVGRSCGFREIYERYSMFCLMVM
jgi:hypothetical protein